MLEKFKKTSDEQRARATQIQEICCDMSPAFIRGIQEQFPEAKITFDKFHVMKMVNEAVDEVRREEQKQVPELKNSRYL